MDFARGFGGFIPFPALARAHGAPPVTGVLRREPADFRVDEELGFEPEGSGPHHWLMVRKTGCTTPYAARLLAARYALPVREVGFAGLKDRHAETTQWFTVPARAPGHDPGSGEIAAGVRIVRAVRGRRKLRRGVHAGNRFAITIRDVEGDRKAFADRVGRVARAGVPELLRRAAIRAGRGERRRRGRNVARRREAPGPPRPWAVPLGGTFSPLQPGSAPARGGRDLEHVRAGRRGRDCRAPPRARPGGVPPRGRAGGGVGGRAPGAPHGGRSGGAAHGAGSQRRRSPSRRRRSPAAKDGRPGWRRPVSRRIGARFEWYRRTSNGTSRRRTAAWWCAFRSRAAPTRRPSCESWSGTGPAREARPAVAAASRPSAQRGGADRGPAALRSEQYVDRPGAPGVVGGGAEREDAVATAKPPVHDRLQHRPPLRGAPSLAVDDTHAAKAAPPRAIDELEHRALGFGCEESVQIEPVLDRVVAAAEPADLPALKAGAGELDAASAFDVSARTGLESLLRRPAACRRRRRRGRAERPANGSDAFVIPPERAGLAHVLAKERSVVVVRGVVHFGIPRDSLGRTQPILDPSKGRCQRPHHGRLSSVRWRG